jgi:hypothetical protein
VLTHLVNNKNTQHSLDIYAITLLGNWDIRSFLLGGGGGGGGGGGEDNGLIVKTGNSTQ